MSPQNSRIPLDYFLEYTKIEIWSSPGSTSSKEVLFIDLDRLIETLCFTWAMILHYYISFFEIYRRKPRRGLSVSKKPIKSYKFEVKEGRHKNEMVICMHGPPISISKVEFFSKVYNFSLSGSNAKQFSKFSFCHNLIFF